MSRNHERQMQAELTSVDVQAPFEPLGNVEYRGHSVLVDMHPFDPDPNSKHHWTCGCGDCACHGNDGAHSGMGVSCPTGYNDPYPPYENSVRCSCLEMTFEEQAINDELGDIFS